MTQNNRSMPKLKTLKNLKFEDCLDDDGACGDPECCGEASYSVDEDLIKKKLKEEAIKWIKNCDRGPCSFRLSCFACQRFIDFFNIKEKELQDGT